MVRNQNKFKIFHHSSYMPIITIQMSEGRTIEQKKTVASAITQTVANTFSIDPAAVIILFQELPRECIAKGGELVSDGKQ